MRNLRHSLSWILSFGILLLVACGGQQPKSVTVQPETVTLHEVGANAMLTPTVKDEEGTIMMVQNIVWASSAPGVAKVEKGKITAVGPGDAVITATVGKIKGKAQVSVTPPASVEVEPAGWEGNVGQETQFAASVKDKNGTVIPGLDVTWSSDNEKVVKVSEGRASAVGAGDATVIADHKGIKGTAKLRVKVVTFPVAKIMIKPATKTLKVAASTQLVATAQDAKKKPLSGVQFAWKSSSDKVATVAGGQVVGRSKGKATITASAGGKSATATVTVKK